MTTDTEKLPEPYNPPPLDIRIKACAKCKDPKMWKGGVRQKDGNFRGHCAGCGGTEWIGLKPKSRIKPNEAAERLDETQGTTGDRMPAARTGVGTTIHRYENGKYVGDVEPTQGHTPGRDHDGPLRTHTAQQVNAIQAQVQMCQNYIVFIEKEIKRIVGEYGEGDDVQLKIGNFLAGWRIIQDENAMLKAQMETLREEFKNEIDEWIELSTRNSGVLRKIIPGWEDWDDFSRCLKVYEDDQRHMREDNANQAATIARLELENKSLTKWRDIATRRISEDIDRALEEERLKKLEEEARERGRCRD